MTSAHVDGSLPQDHDVRHFVTFNLNCSSKTFLGSDSIRIQTISCVEIELEYIVGPMTQRFDIRAGERSGVEESFEMG